MVQFNKLKINPEGTLLCIDASIEDIEYYKDVYIDSVIIDDQNTYTPSGPSENPVYECTYDVPVKHIFKELSVGDLENVKNLNDSIFYVYIVTTGDCPPDTPKEFYELHSIGVVYNEYPIYNLSMEYFKEMGRTCELPKNLINLILRTKALELSLKAHHYTQANKYWNKFFTKENKLIIYDKCHE